MAGAGLSLTSLDKNIHIAIAIQIMPIISLAFIIFSLYEYNRIKKTTTPATAKTERTAISPIRTFFSPSFNSDHGFCFIPIDIAFTKS